MSKSEVSTVISPDDEMHRVDPVRYSLLGESALESVRLALRSAARDSVEKVLDFACGHGRVLRHLRAEFPEAQVTACDVDRGAVDFCAGALGAIPVYSDRDPGRIALPDQYDLIWVGSLITHFPSHRANQFLELLRDALTTKGVLVFTANGATAAKHIRQPGVEPRQQTWGIYDDAAKHIYQSFTHTGFGYAEYPNPPDGISMMSPAWVCAHLAQFPDLRLVLYREDAWCSQDVVGCVRVG